MLSLCIQTFEKLLCVFREINIPFGAIIELINKTQDKWIFLAELWKKLFLTTFSNCTTDGKSLIFSYNPASDFPFIGRNSHKKYHAQRSGIRKYIEMGTERFFNLSFELWYFHPQTLFDAKQKGIYRISISFYVFPLFNFPFLFITKMSQAQQAAADMINQTIAKMSFGGKKHFQRKSQEILIFLSIA